MNYLGGIPFEQLDHYCLDAAEFLNDYEIESENFKDGYYVLKGFLKNTCQAVKIIRRPFQLDQNTMARFRKLVDAFNLGILLADNIFLSRDGSSMEYDQAYSLYIIEPRFLNWNDKFMQLDKVIKLELPFQKKKHLFQKLAQALGKLHSLGVPHLQICPKNVWIEDQQHVYLRPFKLDFHEIKKDFFSSAKHCHSASFQTTSSASWYLAPEVFFLEDILSAGEGASLPNGLGKGDEFFVKGYSSDVWGLGCIFGEMFVSLTPIFQTIDTGDKFFKYFDVLGIPKREDAFYVDDESFRNIANTLSSEDNFDEREGPLIETLLKRLSAGEAELFRKMLHVNPLKRPDPESILSFDFFSSDASKFRRVPDRPLLDGGLSANFQKSAKTGNFVIAEETLGNKHDSLSEGSYQNFYETGAPGLKNARGRSGHLKEFTSPDFNKNNLAEGEGSEESKALKRPEVNKTPPSEEIRSSCDVFPAKGVKSGSSGKFKAGMSQEKLSEERRAKLEFNNNSEILAEMGSLPEESDFEVHFRIKTSKLFLFRKDKPKSLALKALIDEDETAIISSFIPLEDNRFEFSSEIQCSYAKLKKNLMTKKLSVKFYEKNENSEKTRIELLGTTDIDMCMIFLDSEEKMGFNKIYLTGWHGIHKPDSYSSRTIGKIKAEFSVRKLETKKAKRDTNLSRGKNSHENSSFVLNRPPRPLSIGRHTVEKKTRKRNEKEEKENEEANSFAGANLFQGRTSRASERSSLFSAILQDMEELNNSLLKKDQDSFYVPKNEIKEHGWERSRSAEKEKEKLKTIDKLKNILFGEE